MNPAVESRTRMAIACGGTGGHLFPGLAVAEQLEQRGCAVTLLISPKDIDQQAVRAAKDMEIVTLPAVGLTRKQVVSFACGFVRAYRTAQRTFQACPPQAVLAMGGFTSAPPLMVAKRLGARTFLHESNSIPGRANRWLSRVVDQGFVGFPSAAGRLSHAPVSVTGTPVRRQFQPRDAGSCRAALGLDPARPVVLVMGGSQGARGLNQLVQRSLPLLSRVAPHWQWLHLAGAAGAEEVGETYASLQLSAAVHGFFGDMELALGAATAAVSRAGASSLAELAAVRVPAVLVPYPAATDNHQFHNARAFAETGAARLLEQRGASAEDLARLLVELMQDSDARARAQAALGQWHAPQAAENIAEAMVQATHLPAQPAADATPDCAAKSRLGGFLPKVARSARNLF